MALATVSDYTARYGTAGVDPDRVATLLADASALVEKIAGRPLDAGVDVEVTLDGYGSPVLFLPGTPVLSVTSVISDGDTLVEGTDFEAWEHGELRNLRGGWPDKPRSVVVTYTYGEAPPDWLVALVCLMANRTSKEAGRGAVASESFGAGEYAVSFRGQAGLVGLSVNEAAEVRALGFGSSIV